MKIISGIYKGRVLDGFTLKGTRPTMDRVKESLFAMIQDDISDSVVLDLFSGSGNLGIEAISQGAKYAYCNDKGKDAIRVIRKNIERLDIATKVEIMNYDFKKCLSLFREKNTTFDLIFLDPPYDTTYVSDALILIEEYQLLKPSGKIICEVDKLERIPSTISYSAVKSKKYGDKYVVILK